MDQDMVYPGIHVKFPPADIKKSNNSTTTKINLKKNKKIN